MSTVSLGSFRNEWFQPGRSKAWQIAWFLFGATILRCRVLPSSGIRVRLLRMFGAQVGSGVVIRPGVKVKFPWHLRVGDHTWIGEDCWIDNLTTVELGSNVCVSQGAYFCTGNHDWSDPSFGLIVKPITVRDGAWVGAKAILAPGVVMDYCSIASAGSVMMGEAKAYGIYAGNPAVWIRTRRIRTNADQMMPVEFSQIL